MGGHIPPMVPPRHRSNGRDAVDRDTATIRGYYQICGKFPRKFDKNGISYPKSGAHKDAE